MMKKIYQAPDIEEILLMPGDAIALSEEEDDDEGSWGVPFSLRDQFNTFED